MAKQNIYDNDSFFENFKNLRNNKINFNDCIETPILLAMIPEVDGKRVLDIGCGMGQHAKQYSDMGAESVLGIDISEKMLEYAKEHFHAKNITYRQMALEDICQIDEQFDLITSSLAFDYAEDLDKLMKNIYTDQHRQPKQGHYRRQPAHAVDPSDGAPPERLDRRPEGEKGGAAGSTGTGKGADHPRTAFPVSGYAERGTHRLDFQGKAERHCWRFQQGHGSP